MTLATLAALMLLTAEPNVPAAPTQAEERAAARERYTERMHTELSFGYLGEWRDDSARSFEPAFKDGPAGIAGLTAPFAGAPFSGYAASGMTVESRVVYDRVRFSLGVRWPFASYRVASTASTADFGGASHEVLVRSVSMFGFRTGLGVELPFGVATPFVDAIGDVENVSTALVVDGDAYKWASTGFRLGARTGVRFQISQVFVQVAGEASALGGWRFGGSLQAGVAF